jgi:hypothetical protein
LSVLACCVALLMRMNVDTAVLVDVVLAMNVAASLSRCGPALIFCKTRNLYAASVRMVALACLYTQRLAHDSKQVTPSRRP